MLKRVILVLLLLTATSLFFNYQIAHAECTGDTQQCLDQIISQISDLQHKLDNTRSQEKTLKSQLDTIDSQIKISQLKIDQTNYQIIKLTKEISELSGRITRLSSTVDSISRVLLTRIVQTYKFGNVSTIDLLFSSYGFSDLLERLKYIEVAQTNDKKVLYELQATKNAYNDQKVDRESRQVQENKLKVDLQKYQQQLESQKKAKQELLKITQNDETKYQQLLSQLRAEQESISRALTNVGVIVGPVEKGQQIAANGSTGCSTGPHLHFEVFNNAKVEGGKVVGTRVNPMSYLNDGRLGPPIRGYPNDTTITTEYGEVYFLGTHTGVDIAPKRYEGVGRPILASEKGIAYSTSAPCTIKISGGSAVGKGLIVDHQNGLVTLYWHVL